MYYEEKLIDGEWCFRIEAAMNRMKARLEDSDGGDE